MKTTTFECGVEFKSEGKTFVVTETLGRVRRIKEIESTQTKDVSSAELNQRLKSGHLVIKDLLADDAQSTLRDEVPASLLSYSEGLQKKAMFKASLIRAVAPRMYVNVPRKLLPDALRQACSELNASAHGYSVPSASTFYEWLARYRIANGSAAALVDRVHLRGRHPKPIPGELAAVLNRVIEAHYLTGNRASMQSTLEHAIQEVNLHNQARPEACQLARPTRHLIKRLIEQVDRYHLVRARNGKAAAERATRVYLQTVPDDRIGARVEVDHTPLDLLCVDDATGLILGRPYLTVLIDVSTRVIVGLWISFREPNAATVLRALKHAILPKADLMKSLGIKTAWPAQGVMSVLVLDNGKEFHSTAVERAAADLGITLVFCPPKAPTFKGTVERWLKEINYNFSCLLPGATFAKYYLRGDYETVKNCVLSQSELRRMVYRWVVEVYHRRFHRGLQMCPLEKWEDLAKDKRTGCSLVPPLPANLDVLDVYLSPISRRVLSSKGIEINSQHYGGPRLAALRSKLGSPSLEVRVDPDDLGYINVLDPETKTYFKAPNARGSYADGVTQEQHEMFLRHARERYKSFGHYEALLAAKHEMLEEARSVLAKRQREEEVIKAAADLQSKRGNRQRSAFQRPAKSGLEAQSRSEIVATAKAMAPPVASVCHDFSFDEIEGFPTGQADLF